MSTATTFSQQRARILGARGIETRTRRAELKRRLTNGEVHVAELLDDPPGWAEGMRLSQILMALPRVRREKSRRAIRAVQATEYSTLGGLTQRQREQLLEYFRIRHPALWDLWGVMAKKRTSESL